MVDTEASECLDASCVFLQPCFQLVIAQPGMAACAKSQFMREGGKDLHQWATKLTAEFVVILLACSK